MTLIIMFVAIGCAYVVYAAAAGFISSGIHKHYSTRNELPSLSIVVPARNEEENIADLLDSSARIGLPGRSPSDRYCQRPVHGSHCRGCPFVCETIPLPI